MGALYPSPSHFTPRETALVPTESDAGLAPEPIWRFWRKEKSLGPARIQTPNHPIHSLAIIQ